MSPKLWIVLGHLATLGAWIYGRRSVPPLERFTLNNTFALASLTTAAGLLGPDAFPLIAFALPFVYNLVRYYPEYKAYAATPRAEREGAQSKSSRINQRAVEIAGVVVWIAVLVFALQRELMPRSRHWFFVALLPGIVGVLIVGSEVVVHRRMRSGRAQ
jgi:4-hydroxybenzoate polyprenyltransferase